MRMKLYWIIPFIFLANNVQGQTCCSGGVPLSGNLGLPLTDVNTWQISLSYDWNVLKTLQTGTEKLDDDTRKRTTYTTMMQVGYSFNKKFALEALLPYVRQERLITPIGQRENFEATNGIGDVVLLTKYRFYKNYQAGVGLKFPTGSSTKNNSLGLPLNADLQPGSGAWDVIFWASGSESLKIRHSATLSLVATYRATGENKDYLGSQVYEFGNEFQTIFAYADQLLIANQIVSPTLGFKFRGVQNDVVDDFNVPSTGGQWVFFRPGVTFVFSKSLSFATIADLPIYANITGTQVTPTFRLNFALYLTLANNKNFKI